MQFLTNILNGQEAYQKLASAVGRGSLPAGAVGLSPVHKAQLVYALTHNLSRPALLVTADEGEAAKLYEDLSNMMGEGILLYPYRDLVLRDVEGTSREYEYQRLHVLARMQQGDYRVVICPVDALLQYTVPPTVLAEKSIALSTDHPLPLEALINALFAAGYARVDKVEGAGQFCVRGGIVDYYCPADPAPVRVEYWGDEIDTLSFFDLDSQRRTDPTESLRILPCREVFADPKALAAMLSERVGQEKNAQVRAHFERDAELLEGGGTLPSFDRYIALLYDKATLFDYLDARALFFVSEQANVRERAKSALWQQSQEYETLLEEGILSGALCDLTLDYDALLQFYERRGAIYLENFLRGGSETGLSELVHFNAKTYSPWGGLLHILLEDIREAQFKKHAVVVLSGTKRSGEKLALDIAEEGIDCVYMDDPAQVSPGKVIVTEGFLSSGFEYDDAQFTLITHQRTAARKKARAKKHTNTEKLLLSELRPGDYVVHSFHGIGVFKGIEKLEVEGVVKDYIKIQYAGSDALYVPVTQFDLVSRYIGPSEDSRVRLHKMGGGEWKKQKTRVKSAVKDMAKELTALYSKRMQLKGFAFSHDDDMQLDFEERFPYEETGDQLRCTDEIKRDMQSTVPMDRLLCGDVGFGKTEVALRAAFKCVLDGKQCAILVPTTILAWQHYNNIIARMDGFPVNVEMLSRFRTPAQSEEVQKKLHRGEVDIVVGTHKLLQKSVKFHDLGLLIVDEEQRFGVAHKERLKEMAENVDVLTLSATPIPRTLNMALSGIRDMSIIEEAPGDRYPVQTYVMEYDIGILADALRRELRRGGQAYYLINNIEKIDKIAGKLMTLLPDARIGTAHGQMGERELSHVWKQLMDGEIDILVCTTIIETGVDVANVNTLIIEDADRMGLSQLHQIRGRVGRSSRRAFCYLTFRRGKALSEIASKRLTALREFTEFGSGFKIAMRDLEIRGAGNLLGAQQHGHMEAVGYDMYMRLLAEAVREEKGETPRPMDIECTVDLQLSAHIPKSYITDDRERLYIYKRIAGIKNDEDYSDVLDELIDRFSQPPESVIGLLDVALLRSRAAALSITDIVEKNGALLFYFKTLDMERVGKLVSALPGRVMLSAGTQAYLTVKKAPGQMATDTIREVLDTFAVQL